MIERVFCILVDEIFPDRSKALVFQLELSCLSVFPRGGGVVGVTETVAALELLDVATLSRDEVREAFGAATRVQGWLDAKRARLARRLGEIAEDVPSMFAEADIAEATKTSRSDAGKATRRAKTLDDVPELEEALAAGGVSTEHVDAVGRALRRLQPELGAQLTADGERLAQIAARSTPEEFEQHLKREVARLDEREGGQRLARQKRAIRLRSWTDKDSGMVIIRCELDPETGLRVLSRIDATADRLFHRHQPADCPEGEDKHDHLRAAAFVRLLDRRENKDVAEPAGSGGPAEPVESVEPAELQPEAEAAADADLQPESEAAADIDNIEDMVDDPAPPAGDPHADDHIELTTFDNRCEMVVIIDLHTLLHGLHERSIISNGHNVELPVESYRRMACNASIIPVVLDGDGVALDEGRAKRLATSKQRLALYAMYDTCGIPGCTVSSRHCQPHHIRWSSNFGNTDLDNLIPVCSRHHHAVHEGGWQLVMHRNRSLTITYPDGSIRRSGPPGDQRRWRRSRAA